jgi:peptidoglycan hydrolase CwlO-like protein
MTDPTNLSPDAISAIAAVVGAVAVKLFEKYVTSKSNKSDDEVKKTLQSELDKSHADIIALRVELQHWQTKYWEAQLDTDSDEHAMQRLASNVETLQQKIEDLEFDAMEIERNSMPTGSN